MNSHIASMRKGILTALIILMSSMQMSLKAQDLIITPAESVGAAGIMSLPIDKNAASIVDVVNPALMSKVAKADISASYTIPYHLSELGQMGLHGVVATKLVNISVLASRSGDDVSHFTSIGGGLSRSFGKWGMGLEYNALIHQLDDNKKYASSYSRVGLYVEPNGRWLLSVALHSIERREIEYEYSKMNIDPVVWAGIRWHGTSFFSLLLEVEKRWERDVEGKLAVVLMPIDKLSISAGFSTKGQSLSAGVGYMVKGLSLHAGVSYHDRLGVTSGASVGIMLRE